MTADHPTTLRFRTAVDALDTRLREAGSFGTANAIEKFTSPMLAALTHSNPFGPERRARELAVAYCDARRRCEENPTREATANREAFAEAFDLVAPYWDPFARDEVAAIKAVRS